MGRAIARWFLRRFKAFRDIELRVQELETRLATMRAAKALQLAVPRGSAKHLELCLLYTLNLELPLHIHGEVLPTVEDADLAPGQLQLRIFQGARRG